MIPIDRDYVVYGDMKSYITRYITQVQIYKEVTNLCSDNITDGNIGERDSKESI